ncbi:MAG: class I SAM-dependent methyltransferase [Sulfolobaceae archaeon]
MINIFQCPIDGTNINENLECERGHKYSKKNNIYNFILNNKIETNKKGTTESLEVIAPIYEQIWAPIGFYITSGVRYSTLFKKISILLSGNIIIDIGTGTGKIFDYLNCNICIGIDISFKFLEILNKKRGNKVIPVRADATKLPIRSNIADGITSILVLHMLDNPSLAISEIYRVLKSKGIFISVILANPSSIFSKILSRLWRIRVRNKEYYISEMKNIGFDIVHIENFGPWVKLISLKP